MTTSASTASISASQSSTILFSKALGADKSAPSLAPRVAVEFALSSAGVRLLNPLSQLEKIKFSGESYKGSHADVWRERGNAPLELVGPKVSGLEASGPAIHFSNGMPVNIYRFRCPVLHYRPA